MVTLISRWKVRLDITDSDWATLVNRLQSLATTVETAEAGTLVYRVHTTAPDPRSNNHGNANAYAVEDRAYITFYEVYESEQAFLHHLQGQPFIEFLDDNLKYFERHPGSYDSPLVDTTFLHKESGFVRPQLEQEQQR